MALIAMILVVAAPFRPVYAYTERVALLIGLEKYGPGQGKGIFRDLPFSTNDLEAVGTVLEDIGFVVYVYSDVNKPLGSNFEYRTLLPADHSLAAIPGARDVERIISHGVSAMKDNSLLLVYFTGHGGVFNKEVRALALPQSERLSEHSYLQGSFVDVQNLLETMDLIADNKSNVDTMLVVDACADNLGRGRGYSSRMNFERGPAFIYSSSLLESSYFDSGLKLSVFTNYFVEAIRVASDAPGGEVRYKHILRYVEDKVPNHRYREQKKKNANTTARHQTPSGYGAPNLLLGQSRRGASYATWTPGDLDEELEARLMGLARASYEGTNEN